MTTIHLDIDLAELKVVFNNIPKTVAASKYRPHLTGVLVDAEAGYLVGTDGHALAQLKLAEETLIDLRPAVAAWCERTGNPNLLVVPWKLQGKAPVSLTFANDNSIIANQGPHRTILDTSPSDFRYVDWKRVSLTGKTLDGACVSSFGVDLQLVARFNTATPSESKGIRIEFQVEDGKNPGYSAMSGIRVTCSDRLSGVIMPMRL